MYEIVDCLRRIARAVEDLKQNNERVIGVIENRLAELKREFSACETQFEIYEFECNHLAIEELENLLINLKRLK